MDPEKRKRLEAAGWKVGDAADFLELTGVERQLVEVRLERSRPVRAAREAKGWTQGALAKAIGPSQSRAAKLEMCAHDVSIDLMLRALFTIGRQIPEGLPIPVGFCQSAIGRSRLRSLAYVSVPLVVGSLWL
jgi:hypothetical protein